MARTPAIIAAALLCLGASTFAPAFAQPPPSEARRYLSTVQESPDLQRLLDETFADLSKRDASLRRTDVRLAVLELDGDGPPRLAQLNGHDRVYPASVVKFVYLMAAYAFRDQGRLAFDAELDDELHDMIFQSSNAATQKVFARVTATEPGPELAPAAYADFKHRRLSVKRWLQELGIDELHCVNPTYDGGGDISPRDRQFLRDGSLEGALPSESDGFRNRQAMTAVDTVELLALSRPTAPSPASSADVRRRMTRKVALQPHLALRIAGGAERVGGGFTVVAKTGTWGPIFADAGIVRAPDGRALVIAAYLESVPAYRGSFIADLTEHLVRARLVGGAKKP
jgi:beta-lactamase class A